MRFTVAVRLTFLFAALFLVAVFASAQITPSGDSYTSTADPTTNYGAATLLYVNGATETAYIEFNLASIPFGANISQATLKLYVNSVTKAGSFNVDLVNGSWSEGTIDASNAPSLGGAVASNVNVTTADKNQYILVDVTQAVGDWLGGEGNFGIALVANSTFSATFDSKENTSTSHPAELDVVFVAVQTVNTEAGSGLVGGASGGTVNLSMTNTCSTNQILQWNGSNWVCSSAGTGTITSVVAGTDLSGGGNSGPVTLNVDTTKVPQLAAANTFTGNQTVNGNLSATGVVTGTAFQIGSNLFGFGTYNSGNGSAFLGFAGNTTMTGFDNTAVGYQALYSNTIGNQNTAMGSSALSFDTTGGGNTAMGSGALYFNTAGGNNTAVGVSTLGYNTSGTSNTAAGTFALGATTTGSYNSAVGFGSGQPSDGSSMTGSYNTFLGDLATVTTGTLSNATAIGYNAQVGESNALVLGSIYGVGQTPWADTSVGIGTTTPRTKLEIDANAPNALGPTLTMTNTGGLGKVSLDFNTYTPSTSGTYNPSARILLTDLNDYSDQMQIQFNVPGAPNQTLQPVIVFNPPGTDFVEVVNGNAGIDGSLSISGSLNVNGTVTKGGGSFKIDHPLDPANKYLYHSFVESPDMMNIYNGVVTLDSRGSAWITMPDYFEALNRDFRYQLTSMGRPQPSLYIAAEILGHRFRIAGGKAGGRVSWQVTGIRHDAYADAHRIPIEEDKPAEEQGRYLHPELFGAPREKAVGYREPAVPPDAADNNQIGQLAKR